MSELIVKEIFYSLQGEGARVGTANIFIRLALCNRNCWFCDTNWDIGMPMKLSQILTELKKYNCNSIIWTGGEPTLQLTSEIIQFFKNEGYYQALETNGSNKIPEGLDYISCSPKERISPAILYQNLGESFKGEFRYIITPTKLPPSTYSLPKTDSYFVSPMFLGEKKKRLALSKNNVEFAISYVKMIPAWRLSFQQHKVWGIE